MRNVRIGALVALALAAGVGALALGAARGVLAQSSDTVVKVTGPAAAVKKGDDRIPFDVTVDNVKNLASFQFEMAYDADILEYEDAQKGEFLGSTGREVVCNPVTEAGVARFTCVTLRPTPLGPDGSGTLATLYFKATGSGTTDIKLDRVKMNSVTPDAQGIPMEILIARVEGTSFSVAGGGSGFNWLLWGPVIGVGALAVAGGGAFVAMRSRARGGTPAAAV